MHDTPNASTSVTLLVRLREHPDDQHAWERFVKHYGPMLYRWCRRWGLQDADAQDVTQRVLLKLTSKLGQLQYDPGKSFRAWLHTLARHAWSDYVEDQGRSGLRGADSALFETAAQDDFAQRLQVAFDEEALELAQQRVQTRVEPHTWEAFRLLAVDGSSGADVAARLGMKIATVYVARSKVQKMLQEEVCRIQEGA
jgi:RNA polymerase sigma-70 factor (ECF subfamily)